MNKRYINNTLDTERNTLYISDDEKRFAMIDTLTIENGEELDPYQVTIRYQYDNHLGSACLELDNAGQIISYEEYHPFGTTSYRSGRSQTEVSLKRYKYCGKERDEETGLYYYGMRYYAAWICRFISVDPLQFKYPHYTPYQYAGNKPITYIDLDGGEEYLNRLKDYAKEKGVELIEKSIYASLKTAKQVAKKTINSQIDNAISGKLIKYSKEIAPNISNYNEDEKQQQFKISAEQTKAILLYEFATGEGPNERKFSYKNPITKELIKGYVIREIKNKFYAYVKEKGLTYNDFTANNKSFKSEVMFSPDDTNILDSLFKHIFSNKTQFYVGGMEFEVTPSDKDGWVNVSIINVVDRRSVGLHVLENKEGQGEELSTKIQIFTFSFKVDKSKFNQDVKNNQ